MPYETGFRSCLPTTEASHTRKKTLTENYSHYAEHLNNYESASINMFRPEEYPATSLQAAFSGLATRIRWCTDDEIKEGFAVALLCLLKSCPNVTSTSKFDTESCIQLLSNGTKVAKHAIRQSLLIIQERSEPEHALIPMLLYLIKHAPVDVKEDSVMRLEALPYDAEIVRQGGLEVMENTFSTNATVAKACKQLVARLRVAKLELESG